MIKALEGPFFEPFGGMGDDLKENEVRSIQLCSPKSDLFSLERGPPMRR